MKIETLIQRPGVFAAVSALAAVIFVSAAAAAQNRPAPQPAAAVPAPKILVIDRQALMRGSNVGQDIARQVQALTKSAEAELKGQGEGLQKERQALEQQVAILAPDVKAQKIKAFQAKQAAFQQKVQARQNQIRYGVALAQQEVEKAAGPIVQQIMQERGANLMLDRQAVVIGVPGLDVTAVAVQRLNQKLPTVKVQLATPPADLVQRLQAQQ